MKKIIKICDKCNKEIKDMIWKAEGGERMSESNLLINLCSIASIILGLTTMWNMLALDNHSFGIEFITYVLGILGFVMGLLTLFRENRSKK